MTIRALISLTNPDIEFDSGCFLLNTEKNAPIVREKGGGQGFMGEGLEQVALRGVDWGVTQEELLFLIDSQGK